MQFYIMQQIKYFYPQLKLNRGKFVVELLPKQADKGKNNTNNIKSS